MKAHIGVDSKTKLIHSVVATPANVHDSQVLDLLLHGNETRVWGDSAYTGQKDRLARAAPKARGLHSCEGGPAATTDRDGAFAQSDKIESSREGGASVFDSQAALWFFEGSLSWHGEKRQSIVCGLCTDECSDGTDSAEVTLAKRIIAAELRLIGTDRLS